MVSRLQHRQTATAPADSDLEPFPSVDANVGPRHGFTSDTVPLSLMHSLIPQHSFKGTTGSGAFPNNSGVGSGGPRGLSSMSVTSDPENFSLNNHNVSHTANFGTATPNYAGRNAFGRTASVSANASACASPVTVQRPLTAYSSFSASPAFHPNSGAIHPSTGIRVPGLHRASNPIPYATALNYANSSGKGNAAVNGSPQEGPPPNVIGSPSTEAGSAAMANMSLGASTVSTPTRMKRPSRERLNIAGHFTHDSGFHTRPGTSATPNVTSNLQNMSISRVSDADDDDDRVMRDADTELRMPQIFCASCGAAHPVNDCFACSECICGVCRDCAASLAGVNRVGNYGNVANERRPCPSCRSVEGKWRIFRLDFR